MALYTKKPITIEAHQWFKNGDHPQDQCLKDNEGVPQSEGNVVRYFRHPTIGGKTLCKHCSTTMETHGWIDTLEGGHIVCPGDFIITGIQGEHYPCKPDIFKQSYDKIADNIAEAQQKGWKLLPVTKKEEA